MRTRRYGGKADLRSGCLCRSRKECSARAQYAPKFDPLCCIEPGQAGVGLFTTRESFTFAFAFASDNFPTVLWGGGQGSGVFRSYGDLFDMYGCGQNGIVVSTDTPRDHVGL